MANSSLRGKPLRHSDGFAPRVVLGRALQETRVLAADCNSTGFDSLVGNDLSSFDFFARATCARHDARLKV
jgi:hypothetical protein